MLDLRVVVRSITAAAESRGCAVETSNTTALEARRVRRFGTRDALGTTAGKGI